MTQMKADLSITDEFMRQKLTVAKDYSLMILRVGVKWHQPGRDHIIWEHGRRNFQLREEKLISIICPVIDGSQVKGICIFNADTEETKRLMNDDPGVKAGVFTYEVHPCRGFPGDSLAGGNQIST